MSCSLSKRSHKCAEQVLPYWTKRNHLSNTRPVPALRNASPTFLDLNIPCRYKHSLLLLNMIFYTHHSIIHVQTWVVGQFAVRYPVQESPDNERKPDRPKPRKPANGLQITVNLLIPDTNR